MTKKLLLALPDDVHSALKEHQMDRIVETRKHTSLNQLLIELIRSGTNLTVNENTAGMLRRAAAKKQNKGQ